MDDAKLDEYLQKCRGLITKHGHMVLAVHRARGRFPLGGAGTLRVN